jgi:hypothetical protein
METGTGHHCQVIAVGYGHRVFQGRAFGADAGAKVEKHAGIPVDAVNVPRPPE